MHEAPYGPLLTIVLAPAQRAYSPKGQAALFATMVRALEAIVAGDPALSLKVDDGLLAQLGGPDEASLGRAIDAVKAVCPVEFGAPQVSYREAVRSTVKIDRTFKHEGLFARIRLRVAPREGGFAIDPCLPGGLPPALLAAAVEGVKDAARAGTLAGFPVVATGVSVVDGAWHEVDSTPAAFAQAGRHALWEALARVGHLLEPVMRVEASAPEDYEGAIAGDFVSRRAEVVTREGHGDAVTVEALVPLANLLGYAGDLASLTRGVGRYGSRFAFYRAAPRGGRGDPPQAAEAALRA